MRRFLIDTHTASDDAVAILMAHRWPDVQVDAVTIVAGNVPVEMGARNAGYSIELCGKSTPVFPGSPRPLLREPFGRVHWAGTETSTTSHGAIDGAVRSGERAAAEILDRT